MCVRARTGVLLLGEKISRGQTVGCQEGQGENVKKLLKDFEQGRG